ncbi:MAG: N-acetylmuramoyl-L-alanine amidase [Pseudonocardiaceae bacterium]|nr:N-acetylmuramoyl-L-alanine amidase [Pseudonocardiaceae bacterium]
MLGGLACLLALAACGTEAAPTGSASQGSAPGTSASSPASTTPPSATASPASPPTTASPRTAPHPAPVVVLDPGHNGGNASNPDQINAQVPAGRGRMKACNTTGTSTDGGYPEHAFTWDVARRVREWLTARGVRVVLTRQSDTGVGPCVDERAGIGNRLDAAAVVSIHADGASSPDARGFHMAYSAPPLNTAQGEPARRLAGALRDGMRSAGFPPSDYIGSDGLSPRDDLAGLNLSARPAALVECGNMRNPDEAAAFTSPQGRQRYAEAIASSITAYLR